MCYKAVSNAVEISVVLHRAINVAGETKVQSEGKVKSKFSSLAQLAPCPSQSYNKRLTLILGTHSQDTT